MIRSVKSFCFLGGDFDFLGGLFLFCILSAFSVSFKSKIVLFTRALNFEVLVIYFQVFALNA